MDIEWLPIKGYETAYEVSNTGHVRSLDRKNSIGKVVSGRVLTPDTTRAGHKRVKLCREAKEDRFWVHRLVLETFRGPRPDGMEGCHNDGNPANNHIDNLRWDTKSSNALDRRRHGKDANARKTRCPKGHPYTPENTYTHSTLGWRHCRTCTLAGQKAERDRKKGAKAA